jgi:hypothetical protein
MPSCSGVLLGMNRPAPTSWRDAGSRSGPMLAFCLGNSLSWSAPSVCCAVTTLPSVKIRLSGSTRRGDWLLYRECTSLCSASACGGWAVSAGGVCGASTGASAKHRTGGSGTVPASAQRWWLLLGFGLL